MKSPSARYYRLKADISFFGLIILSWLAGEYWAKAVFFILGLLIPFTYWYLSNQAEKEGAP